ncbi:MAG: hypothetical protein AAF899_14835 [Pseudomonadota bacterium]
MLRPAAAGALDWVVLALVMTAMLVATLVTMDPLHVDAVSALGIHQG